ncbi:MULTISPECIES: glycosyltransferase family 2 protein [Prochlorococcus]|uniref:Glycosyltransferase n=1 Tax=Prochlorococcus marinus (strain SARG / CCMP1375 / SS120) TaxID=167539 RepID=Q7VDJ6_PROMA|nr:MULTISPECIES: glycosyltransferase family 2 protein [Prochlorococcus]AAP99426.1 Glycosyltransferase [Prochlorococcus marinus subsp. marinus str. CCMP1375]KGG11307.1 Glycosyltransferase [Prochlorococcus marinus str. LG]KGG18738.1 Glycosyltransferase [Prochlorococcus marinus str. SS2]KGG23012.1 Glycosyltransferase [Prochlorococcus marinus str. SS35]KGG33719.1 Glycosyltransferase [Prochlorococcus marinus str. SS51]
MKYNKLISWIIPCFNEQEVLEISIRRIIDFTAYSSHYDWEFIFVDDGSKDNTRDIIKSYNLQDDRVKLVGLSRNFGHQYAVQAGLNNAYGDAAIIIDADLQDPPEIAKEMISKWEKGFDVISGRRVERVSETFFKKISASCFYRILNLLTEIHIPLDTGDFRLIDRKVIDTLKQMPEKGRFIRGLVSWTGFKQTQIKYKREPRLAGKTKYSLKKMIVFALEGLTAFSSRPLRLATIFGLVCSFFSFLAILYVLYIRLFTFAWVPGWAGLAVAILFATGVQLISIGILGEYIGRIYDESKGRPMYIIDENLGFSKDKD